jgi:hypothetical protein
MRTAGNEPTVLMVWIMKQMITTPSQQTRTQTTIPLLALCPGYFMTILDVTIVNVALVDIKEHLSANVTGLQWIVDGYALVATSLSGRLMASSGSKSVVVISRVRSFSLPPQEQKINEHK